MGVHPTGRGLGQQVLGCCCSRPTALPCACTSRWRCLLIAMPEGWVTVSPAPALSACREELEALAEVVAEHPRLLVLSDEIYE